MLVLITYDVNTETASGKKRLRKVAKECQNYGQRDKQSHLRQNPFFKNLSKFRYSQM